MNHDGGKLQMLSNGPFSKRKVCFIGGSIVSVMSLVVGIVSPYPIRLSCGLRVLSSSTLSQRKQYRLQQSWTAKNDISRPQTINDNIEDYSNDFQGKDYQNLMQSGEDSHSNVVDKNQGARLNSNLGAEYTDADRTDITSEYSGKSPWNGRRQIGSVLQKKYRIPEGNEMKKESLLEPAQKNYASSTQQFFAPSKEISVEFSTKNGEQPKALSVEEMQNHLNSIEETIFELNKGQKFNINSPKQVRIVLFGESDYANKESTSRDVLEGMAAAGNKLADKILLYRQVKSNIRREMMKKERLDQLRSQNEENSSYVATEHSSVEFQQRIITKEDMGTAIYLVDISAFIFRAYHAFPPLHRADGMPVGAVLGVCNMINRLVLDRLIRGEQPRLVFVFDSKGPSFRQEIFADYKANRPPCPIDLLPQFELVGKAAHAYGIPCVEAKGYEADDVIATLATIANEEANMSVKIISSDKDLMQLIKTPSSSETNFTAHIHMIDPVRMIELKQVDVVEKWGVEPNQLGDLLALAGDSADNIPGVPGIGPKTAALLLKQYGSLEKILENVDDIKQKGRRETIKDNSEQAILSRKLVELNCTVPSNQIIGDVPPGGIKDFIMYRFDWDRLSQFYSEMGFWDMNRRVSNKVYKSSKKNTASVDLNYDDFPF